MAHIRGSQAQTAMIAHSRLQEAADEARAQALALEAEEARNAAAASRAKRQRLVGYTADEPVGHAQSAYLGGAADVDFTDPAAIAEDGSEAVDEVEAEEEVVADAADADTAGYGIEAAAGEVVQQGDNGFPTTVEIEYLLSHESHQLEESDVTDLLWLLEGNREQYGRIKALLVAINRFPKVSHDGEKTRGGQHERSEVILELAEARDYAGIDLFMQGTDGQNYLSWLRHRRSTYKGKGKGKGKGGGGKGKGAKGAKGKSKGGKK